MEDDRMTYYQPHSKSDLDSETLARIRKTPIGEVSGMEVWRVDGEVIRNAGVDIDFTMGGNPGRYRYVPNGEVWIEQTLSPSDALGAIVHEVVEAFLMIHERMSYSSAHDVASKHEKKVREAIEAKVVRVDGFADTLSFAKVWAGRALARLGRNT